MSELHSVVLRHPHDVMEWRDHARRLLQAGIPPEQVQWLGPGHNSLFGAVEMPKAAEAAPVAEPRVPAAFLELAASALLHRDRQRHALLYRLLWRLTHGERGLLDVATDLDVVRARSWEKAVERAIHHMQAFVRFRAIPQPDGAPVHVAWYEPDYDIVERVAPWFAKRFGSLAWAILTPERCVHFDGERISFAPGADRAAQPQGDDLEALWRTYYASIFNPARAQPAALHRQMPRRYWKNLPEAGDIPALLRDAAPTVAAMVGQQPAAPRKRYPVATPPPQVVPAVHSLAALHREAAACRRCPLWQPATQVVLGEGPARARVMLVGEQPGDQEDLAGKPFVGPAGQVLDEALHEAGLARQDVYITNAVKHFKFQPRGKRRLHQTASAREQAACLPWLDRELALVQPELVVCLGAVATRALLGPAARLMQMRGRWHELAGGRRVLPTVHPAYLLRISDAAAQSEAYAAFVADLRLAAQSRAAVQA